MRFLLALLVVCGSWTASEAQSLKPGDTIAIQVLQDSKLDRQVVIGPTGMISFPLAGQIQAGGMTPQALENMLRTRLKSKYTTALDITVSLVAVSRDDEELKPRIFVTGEVNRPGPYPIRTKTTVLQAIALAGGLGQFAARRRIQIRRLVNGIESTFLFDYRAFESGTDLTTNIELQPGDVVVVPERGIFE
jgi:polysaccharide export outer membrane protein